MNQVHCVIKRDAYPQKTCSKNIRVISVFVLKISVVYNICSALSRNRDNSRIVLDKVGILTLSGEVGIPIWHGSIPESSLRKVGIGTK